MITDEDEDVVWMTAEELAAFDAARYETSVKLNIALMELCLLLMKDKNETR